MKLKFRNADDIVTLWVERELEPEDGDDRRFIIGWCPELRNTMIVDARNVVAKDDRP